MGRGGIGKRTVRLLIACLAVAAAFCVSSCETLHIVKPAGPAASQRPEIKPAAPQHVFDADAVVKEAEGDISGGRYEEAVKLYKQSLAAHPGNRRLAGGYDRGLLEIKRAADSAFEKKEYAAAGSLYFLVAKNYTHAAPAEAGYLRQRIKSCSGTLTEMGLVSYRKGNLTGAISIWEGVLKFDPGNEEVRKAMETAKVQLKNLSK